MKLIAGILKTKVNLRRHLKTLHYNNLKAKYTVNTIQITKLHITTKREVNLKQNSVSIKLSIHKNLELLFFHFHTKIKKGPFH